MAKKTGLGKGLDALFGPAPEEEQVQENDTLKKLKITEVEPNRDQPRKNFDQEALEELAKIANIDLDTYGIEMLKAGTDLDDFSEEELINLDAKKFEENGVKCVIAQVNTVSIEDVLKRKEKLEEAINNEIEKDNLNLFVFAITDILNSNSQIIALGNRTDIIEKSYKLEDNMAFLEGVVSRKKQILPMVEKNI